MSTLQRISLTAARHPQPQPHLRHRPRRPRPQRNLEVITGGTLPAAAGEVIVQGEDFGAWVAAQRQGWDKLLPAQQWLLETTLGPAASDI